MLPSIQLTDTLAADRNLVVLLKSDSDISAYCQNPAEEAYVRSKLNDEASLVHANQYTRNVFFVQPKAKGHTLPTASGRKEALRKAGYELFKKMSDVRPEVLQFTSLTDDPDDLLMLCEGFVLSSYQFLKYKSHKKTNSIRTILLYQACISPQQITELSNVL